MNATLRPLAARLPARPLVRSAKRCCSAVARFSCLAIRPPLYFLAAASLPGRALFLLIDLAGLSRFVLPSPRVRSPARCWTCRPSLRDCVSTLYAASRLRLPFFHVCLPAPVSVCQSAHRYSCFFQSRKGRLPLTTLHATPITLGFSRTVTLPHLAIVPQPSPIVNSCTTSASVTCHPVLLQISSRSSHQTSLSLSIVQRRPSSPALVSSDSCSTRSAPTPPSKQNWHSPWPSFPHLSFLTQLLRLSRLTPTTPSSDRQSSRPMI